MVMGFGQTEMNEAHRIINECKAAIDASHDGLSGSEILNAIEEKYHMDAANYGAMKREDAPQRYTHFWFFYHEIYEGKYMIEFSMHHINRQHPLSPDGWGLLQAKWILSVEPDEMHIFHEA